MFETVAFQQLDHITLNFNERGIALLNIALAFIMFGVALGMQQSHFTRLIKAPKPILIGLVSQYIFLPILTLGLVFVLGLPPSISLGMILVSACPGGNISNYISYLAGANAALSVTLTATSDLLSIFMTPLIFSTLGNLYLGSVPLANPIDIPFLEVFKSILLITAIPIGAGFLFKRLFPILSLRILRPLKISSFILFIGFVLGAIVLNYEHFTTSVWLLLPIVILHNSFALLTGYLVSGLFGLKAQIQRTITIETGIQNSGIALALIFNHHIFPTGMGGAALIAALWGIWHIISGLSLGLWWSSKATKLKDTTYSQAL